MNSIRTFSLPPNSATLIHQEKKQKVERSLPAESIHIKEIWDYIFSFLSCKQILPTRSVSRSWCTFTTATINQRLSRFSALLSKDFNSSFIELKAKEAVSNKPIDWERVYKNEQAIDQRLLTDGFKDLTFHYQFLMDHLSFSDAFPFGNAILAPSEDSSQIFLFFQPTDKGSLKTEVLDCGGKGELGVISDSQFKVIKKHNESRFHYIYDLKRTPGSPSPRDFSTEGWEEFYSNGQLILQSPPISNGTNNELQLKIYQTDRWDIPKEISINFPSEMQDFFQYDHTVEINGDFIIVESVHQWSENLPEYWSIFQAQTGKNLLATPLKLLDIIDKTALLYDFDQKCLLKANLKKEQIDPAQDLENILCIDYPEDSLFTDKFYFFIVKNQIVTYDLARRTTHKQDLPKFVGEIVTRAEFFRVTSQLMMILTHTQNARVNSERMLVFEFSNGTNLVPKEHIDIKGPFFSSDSHIFQVDKANSKMTILQYAPSPDYKWIERRFTLEKPKDLDD